MILYELFSQLDFFLKENFLVVGIGNEMRGDDGIGVYLANEGGKKFPS